MWRATVRTVAISLLLTLAACAGAGRAAKTGGEAALPSVSTDKFSQSIEVSGVEITESRSSESYKTWFLRSFVDKSTGAVEHQLYVEIGYAGAKRYYEYAADDTAQILPVVRLLRRSKNCPVLGLCSRSEALGIYIGDAKLRSIQATGFQVKISARLGADMIISIAPAQIGTQLSAVDATVAQVTGIGGAAPSRSDAKVTFGVSFRAVNSADRAITHVPGDHGLIVVRVEPAGPAERAGIKVGDVLLAFDGQELHATADLTGALRQVSAGTGVQVLLWKGGAEREVQVQF